MGFDLFITSPQGHTRKALRSPYDRREDTAATVRAVITDLGRHAAAVEEFARKVTDAPLGETVTHEPTGTTFRTEEH
jgi:hypothetical protein